jgi:hypothetical protein
MSDHAGRRNLMHDLFFPVLLFAALGGMTWAVRGSSGFGAMKGCLFAGIAWGAAWWFLARDPREPQSRRYASGWIILAVTVGIGIAGARGWMQWPSFFLGKLQTDTSTGAFVPIDRFYGFLWLFIAGVPWAGLGACMLAWCGSLHRTRAWEWTLRLACGLGGAFIASYLYLYYPQFFLPLYKSLGERYEVFLEIIRAGGRPSRDMGDPNLLRLINDNNAAIRHMGLYLGFLLFEVGRRDWKNVGLIVTVGVVNGLGWALCQNWQWAQNATDAMWPTAKFNFWRAWESSGGISIGIAFGLAYFLVNRRMSQTERSLFGTPWPRERLNFVWLVAAAILIGVGWVSWLRPVGQIEFFAIETAQLTLGKDTVALAIAAIGGACLFGFLVHLAYHLKNGKESEGEHAAPRAPGWSGVDWVAGCLLMLPLAWFLRSQLMFPEEIRERRLPGWLEHLSFGNFYFAVAVLYALACLLYLGYYTMSRRRSSGRGWFEPGYEWLAIYLGLLAIMAHYFSGEFSRWYPDGQGVLHLLLGAVPVVFYFFVVAALFGIAYYLRTFSLPREELALGIAPRSDANLERFGAYAGLLVGLGLALKNGSRGWANIYLANEQFTEDYYGQRYWNLIGPLMLLVFIGIALWILVKPRARYLQGDRFPMAYGIIWTVLIVLNVIAQFITGPYTAWEEVAYNIYYLLLFLISVAVIYHYHFLRTHLPALVVEEPRPAPERAPDEERAELPPFLAAPEPYAEDLPPPSSFTRDRDGDLA